LNLEKGIATRMVKRNEGQAIENKRFREIADSAPSMISMTCGADAKRLVSLAKRILSFSRFLASSTQETKRALRAGTAAMGRKGARPE
jgi:hypothetical protein